MKTVIICVAFYGLGIFNCAVFAAVYLLHRPRYVAPTMRRKWRDADILGYQPVSGKMPPPPGARVDCEEGVNYSFMGTTGLEE